jgi:hypothetical protein
MWWEDTGGNGIPDPPDFPWVPLTFPTIRGKHTRGRHCEACNPCTVSGVPFQLLYCRSEMCVCTCTMYQRAATGLSLMWKRALRVGV